MAAIPSQSVPVTYFQSLCEELAAKRMPQPLEMTVNRIQVGAAADNALELTNAVDKVARRIITDFNAVAEDEASPGNSILSSFYYPPATDADPDAIRPCRAVAVRHCVAPGFDTLFTFTLTLSFTAPELMIQIVSQTPEDEEDDEDEEHLTYEERCEIILRGERDTVGSSDESFCQVAKFHITEEEVFYDAAGNEVERKPSAHSLLPQFPKGSSVILAEEEGNVVGLATVCAVINNYIDSVMAPLTSESEETMGDASGAPAGAARARSLSGHDLRSSPQKRRWED